MDRGGSRESAGRGRQAGGSRPPPVWFAPVFLVLGLVVVVLGIGHLRDELRLGDRGVTAPAVVLTRTRTTGAGDEPDRYSVRYRFQDGSGQVREGSSDVDAERYASLSAGSSVEITYLPDDPGINRLGSADPQLLEPLFAVALGALFAAVGIVMGAMWLRATRRGPPAQLATATGSVARARADDADMADLVRVDAFTRSAGRVLLDELVQPLGGIAFLGMAWWLLGQLASQPMLIIGVGLATLFGLILLAGAMASWRRGLGRRVLEVGPDGIWLPELGRLPWSQVAEVRLEANRGVGPTRQTSSVVVGGSGSPDGTVSTVVTHPRLGIVPRDPNLVARAPGGVARRLVGGYVELVNGLQRKAMLTDPADMAPYGISAFELEQPIEAAVASIGRFLPVSSEPSAPNLADAASTPVAAVGLGPPALLPSTPARAVEPTERRVFRRRTLDRWELLQDAFALATDGPMVLPPAAGVIGRLLGAVLTIVIAGVLVLLAVGQAMTDGLWLALVPIALVPAVLAVRSLAGLRRRWRAVTGAADLLTVGPAGLQIKGDPPLGWDEVAGIHARDGTLAVTPVDRSRLDGREALELDLDLLDATEPEVLELIGRYRPVGAND